MLNIDKIRKDFPILKTKSNNNPLIFFDNGASSQKPQIVLDKISEIYKSEENEREEIKYLKTTLLLEPDNEEAIYMLIDIKLKKSNFSEVKDLTKKFKIICSTLCDKTKSIDERLKNIEAKNESKQ